MTESPKNFDEAADSGLRLTSFSPETDAVVREALASPIITETILAAKLTLKCQELENQRDKLRAAMKEIVGCGLNCKDSLDEAEQMERIAKEALSPNVKVHTPLPARASDETGVRP